MLGQLFRLSSSTGDSMSFWIRRFLNCHNTTSGNIVDCGTFYACSFADYKASSPSAQVLMKLSLTGDVLNIKRNVSQSVSNFGNEIDKTTTNEIVSVSNNSGTGAKISKFSDSLNSTIYTTSFGTDAVYTLSQSAMFVAGNNVVILNQNALRSFDMSTSTQTWAKSYTTGTSPLYYYTTKDTSGNIYLYGTTTSSVVWNTFTKLDSTGNVVWTQGVRSASGNVTTMYGKTLSVDSSGNMYAIGGAVTNTRMFVVKYNSSGTLQWQKYITVTASGSSVPAIYATDTSVYITHKDGSGYQYISKYNTSGTLLWRNRLLIGTSVGNLDLSDILEVDSGAAIMLRCSGEYGLYICKLPADGTGTGTYGNVTYSASSLTEATGALTTGSFTTTPTTITTSFVGATTNNLIDYNSSYEIL